MNPVSTIVDYALFPGCLLLSMAAAHMLQTAGVPNLVVTPMVVGPFVVLVMLLEWLRPQRAHLPRDFSLIQEAMHFLFNFEFGYGLALGATWLLEQWVRVVLPVNWPSHWPLFWQLILVVLLYEAASYWQHRLFHHRARLWAFHVLHHSGARLDFIRAGRFHFVDFATVAFIAFLPLVILGAPENIVTMLAILVSVLGLLHHGNVKIRTPSWWDYVICTPAVHRWHHSSKKHESNANFGNTVMIFDILFGTFIKPHPAGPESMGIENDPLPCGFWAQLTWPLKSRINSPDDEGSLAAMQVKR